MSQTKLWSLQFSCRRLLREARSLGRAPEGLGSSGREIEQHLLQAAEMLSSALATAGGGENGARSGAGILDLAQAAFGNGAWASTSPLNDYKRPQDSAPSPQHKLGLQAGGNFVSAADLVTFLCTLKKSGTLLIDTVDERFTIEFEGGDIIHAHSDGAPDGERLGDVLVEQKVLTQDALDGILAEGQRGRHGGRLGSRLLERKLATTTQLTAALETQIRRLFQRLFGTAASDFVFWEGPIVWGESSMRLNATMLLLDGARAMDESKRRLQVGVLEALDSLAATATATATDQPTAPTQTTAQDAPHPDATPEAATSTAAPTDAANTGTPGTEAPVTASESAPNAPETASPVADVDGDSTEQVARPLSPDPVEAAASGTATEPSAATAVTTTEIPATAAAEPQAMPQGADDVGVVEPAHADDPARS